MASWSSSHNPGKMSRLHERHHATCSIICQILTCSFRRSSKSHHDTHQEAKASLQLDIERFISKKIILADKVMVKHAVSKIRDGDVLLTYGSSSAVEMLLLQSQELGKQFRVEVVVRSQQGSVAAIESLARRFYGLQYHPEVLSRDPFPASSLQGGSKSFSEKAKVE
ncbi:hypothetical protein ACFX2I_037861 [Malus domestica]